MTGLVRRVTVRQVVPGCARSQDPENAVEDGAVILPGTALAVSPLPDFRDMRRDGCPLFIGEIHTVCVMFNAIMIAVLLFLR